MSKGEGANLRRRRSKGGRQHDRSPQIRPESLPNHLSYKLRPIALQLRLPQQVSDEHLPVGGCECTGKQYVRRGVRPSAREVSTSNKDTLGCLPSLTFLFTLQGPPSHFIMSSASNTSSSLSNYQTLSTTNKDTLDCLPSLAFLLPLQGPPSHFMSSASNTSSSLSNFQTLFDTALVEYAKCTGQDLCSHPLAAKIDRCESPNLILAIFQAQSQAFDQFRNGDPKLTKSLTPVVNELHAISTNTVLSAGASLVSSTSSVFYCQSDLTLTSRHSPVQILFFPGLVSSSL